VKDSLRREKKMKFVKICILGDVCTGSYIISYKEKYYEDGELDSYFVTFENGYILDIDKDEITIKDLKELIKNKTYISIDFKLELLKDS